MKKIKGIQLSRSQLKNVIGGMAQVAQGGLCANGDYNDYDICNNCCIIYMQDQDSPPTNAAGDTDVYGFCDWLCS